MSIEYLSMCWHVWASVFTLVLLNDCAGKCVCVCVCACVHTYVWLNDSAYSAVLLQSQWGGPLMPSSLTLALRLV